MNTYPEVRYPESLVWLKQSRPTVKEVFNVDAPISRESSPLTYVGVLLVSYLVTLLASLVIGSFIKFIFLPLFNSFTPKNDYQMTSFGAYLLFGIIYLVCAIIGFKFFLDDDKIARKNYQKELADYTKLSQELKPVTVLLTFKHEKMRQIMTQSGSLVDGSNARSGVAESAFFHYLVKNSPESIARNFIRGLSVNFDNQQNADINFYTPDIIYQDANLKFRLDIEIDEPYVGSSRQPIHFLKEDAFSKDYFRDQTFLHNNWILVKFSEKQVVNAPKACLEYIEGVIRNTYSVLLQEPEFKASVVSKWTEREAKTMAHQKVREHYLGVAFSSEDYSDNDLPF